MREITKNGTSDFAKRTMGINQNKSSTKFSLRKNKLGSTTDFIDDSPDIKISPHQSSSINHTKGLFSNSTPSGVSRKHVSLLQRIGASFMATVMLFTSNAFAKGTGTGSTTGATYTGDHAQESMELSGGLQFTDFSGKAVDDVTADGVYTARDGNYFYLMFCNKPTEDGSSFYRTVGFTILSEDAYGTDSKDKASESNLRMIIPESYPDAQPTSGRYESSDPNLIQYGGPDGSSITRDNPAIEYTGTGTTKGGSENVTTTCFIISLPLIRTLITSELDDYDPTKTYKVRLQAIQVVQKYGKMYNGSTDVTGSLSANIFTHAAAKSTVANTNPVGFTPRTQEHMIDYYNIPLELPPTGYDAVTIVDITNNYKTVGSTYVGRNPDKIFSMKDLIDLPHSESSNKTNSLRQDIVANGGSSLDDYSVVGATVVPYGTFGNEKFDSKYGGTSAFASWAFSEGAWFSNQDDLHTKIKTKTLGFLTEKFPGNQDARKIMNTDAGWFNATGLNSSYFGPETNSTGDIQFIATPDLSLSESMDWDIKDFNGMINTNTGKRFNWSGTQVYLFVKPGTISKDPGNGNLVFYNNATGATLATAEINWDFVDKEVKKLYMNQSESSNYKDYDPKGVNQIAANVKFSNKADSAFITNIDNYNLKDASVNTIGNILGRLRPYRRSIPTSGNPSKRFNSLDDVWEATNPKSLPYYTKNWGEIFFPNIIYTNFPKTLTTKSGETLVFKGVEAKFDYGSLKEDMEKTLAAKGNTIPNLKSLQEKRDAMLTKPVKSIGKAYCPADDYDGGVTHDTMLYYNANQGYECYVLNGGNENDYGTSSRYAYSVGFNLLFDELGYKTGGIKNKFVSDCNTFTLPTMVSEYTTLHTIKGSDGSDLHQNALAYYNRFTAAHMPNNIKLQGNWSEPYLSVAGMRGKYENYSSYIEHTYVPTGTQDLAVPGYTAIYKDIHTISGTTLTTDENGNVIDSEWELDDDGNPILDENGNKIKNTWKTSDDGVNSFDGKKRYSGDYSTWRAANPDEPSYVVNGGDYTTPASQYLIRVIYEPQSIPVIYYYKDIDPGTEEEVVKVLKIDTVARKSPVTVGASAKINGKTWFVANTNIRSGSSVSKEQDIEKTLKDNTIMMPGDNPAPNLVVEVDQSLISGSTPYVIRVELTKDNTEATVGNSTFEMGTFRIPSNALAQNFSYNSTRDVAKEDRGNTDNSLISPVIQDGVELKNKTNTIDKIGVLQTRNEKGELLFPIDYKNEAYNNATMYNQTVRATILHSMLTKMLHVHNNGDAEKPYNVDGNPLTGTSLNSKTVTKYDGDGNSYDASEPIDCNERITVKFGSISATWNHDSNEIFGDKLNSLIIKPDVDQLKAEVTESAETVEVKSAYSPIIDSWKSSSSAGVANVFAYTLGNHLYYVPDGTTNESGTFEDAIIKMRFHTKFTSSRGYFDFKPTAAAYMLKSDAEYQKHFDTLNDILPNEQVIQSRNSPIDAANNYSAVDELAEDLNASITPNSDEELKQTISITDTHSGNSQADEDHDSQADDWDPDFTTGAIETANFHGFVVADATPRVENRPVVNSPKQSDVSEGTKIISTGTSLEFYPYYKMTNHEGDDVPILSPKPINVPISTTWKVETDGEVTPGIYSLKAILTRGASNNTIAAGSAYQYVADGRSMNRKVIISYVVPNSDYFADSAAVEDYNKTLASNLKTVCDKLGEASNYNTNIITNIQFAGNGSSVPRYAITPPSGTPSVTYGDSKVPNCPKFKTIEGYEMSYTDVLNGNFDGLIDGAGVNNAMRMKSKMEDTTGNTPQTYKDYWNNPTNVSNINVESNGKSNGSWFYEDFPLTTAFKGYKLVINVSYKPQSINSVVAHLKLQDGGADPDTYPNAATLGPKADDKVSNNKLDSDAYIVNQSNGFGTALQVIGSSPYYGDKISVEMHTEPVYMYIKGTAYDYRE